MKKPKKFRPFLMILAGGVLACLIAATFLFYHLTTIAIFNSSGWVTVDGIGSKDADFITRAVIAKIGIFANSKDRAIYLSSHLDQEFNYKKFFSGPKHWFVLSNTTHYRIKGNINIPATWWSITLYDDKEFLFNNPEKRYSFTNYNLVTDSDGNFTIDVASKRPVGSTNWLPAPYNRPFNLKMRIYEPSKEVYKDIATYPLPKLQEVIAQ